MPSGGRLGLGFRVSPEAPGLGFSSHKLICDKNRHFVMKNYEKPMKNYENHRKNDEKL